MNQSQATLPRRTAPRHLLAHHRILEPPAEPQLGRVAAKFSEFLDALAANPGKGYPVTLGTKTLELSLQDIVYDSPKGDFPHPNTMTCKLIGGNKTGNDRWYDTFVPLADRLYEEHLEELKREGLIDG